MSKLQLALVAAQTLTPSVSSHSVKQQPVTDRVALGILQYVHGQRAAHWPHRWVKGASGSLVLLRNAAQVWTEKNIMLDTLLSF